MADDRRGEPPSGDWCGTPHLRFERHPPFAHLVVDRPRYKNTLTPAMYFGIRHAVEHVNRRPELAGLLVRADGETFITGGDLGNEVDDGWPGLGQLGMDLLPFDAVRRSDKPVVVAVNGLCQGGGLMVTLLADVAVASERATFRAPELLRGIADTYYAQILPRQVGPARARDLLLTGRRLGAAEALDWGLVARHGAARRPARGGHRGPHRVLLRGAGGPGRGEALARRLLRRLRPRRHGGEPRRPRARGGVGGLQPAPGTGVDPRGDPPDGPAVSGPLPEVGPGRRGGG